MLFWIILSIIWLFAAITIPILLVPLLGLKKWHIMAPDLTFPILCYAYYWVSDRAFYHSQLPLLLLCLSIIPIGILLLFHFQKKAFSYSRFFKLFWRTGFFVSLILYGLLIFQLFLIIGK